MRLRSAIRFAALCIAVLKASEAAGVTPNEWMTSSTPASCFLYQSIESTDPAVRHASLTLGEFELVSPAAGPSPSKGLVRVTSAVEAVVGAKRVSLRLKGGRSVTFRPHRPGGTALRYAEFNGSDQQAQAFASALVAGSKIEVVFHVGLLKTVRGVISPEGFPERFAEFNACIEGVGKVSETHNPSVERTAAGKPVAVDRVKR